jgi:trimethylamine:corrinoid methyltransferase-like protein
VGASERDEFLRAAWRTTVAAGIGADRFVFVDECSTNTSLRPPYAWSRRGERALCSAPRNWGKNVTLLSSMTLSGMGPSLAVEGATTRAVFEAYVEMVLASSLSPGQVVVMDNLTATREVG